MTNNTYEVKILTDDDLKKISGGYVTTTKIIDNSNANLLRARLNVDDYLPVDHGLYDRKIFGRVGMCLCRNTKVNAGEPKKICPDCKEIVWGTHKELREAIGLIKLYTWVVIPPKIQGFYQYMRDNILPKTWKLQKSMRDDKIIELIWNYEFRLVRDSSGEYKLGNNRYRLEILSVNELTDQKDIGLIGLHRLQGTEKDGVIIDFDKYLNQVLPVMSYAMRELHPRMMNGKRVYNFPVINKEYKGIIDITENILPELMKRNPNGLELSSLFHNYNMMIARYVYNLPIYGGDSDSANKDQLLRDLTRKRSEQGLRASIRGSIDLDMDHLGVPEMMAYNCLGKDIINQLISQGNTMSEAERMYQRKSNEAWTTFTNIIDNCICLIWRAPVLHRPSVFAVKPVLTKEPNIIYPIELCEAQGADFDGDIGFVS